MGKKITTIDYDYLHPALRREEAIPDVPFRKRIQQKIGLSKAEQEVQDALQAWYQNGGGRKKKKKKG